MSYILGISAYYHDSAAVLLKDCEIIAAFQEERFTRIKQDSAFPKNAIQQCLKQAEIGFSEVDLICFYEDGDKKFQRIISTYVRRFPKKILSLGTNLARYLERKNTKRFLNKDIKCFFGSTEKPIFISEHHKSHAASAFFPSPYEKSAILCLDGVGELETTTAWMGDGNNIKALWQINFPHSLGLLYSAFTYYCGFKVDSGEYKLMGLAPYGEPIYVDKILDNIINFNTNGGFSLNMDYFDYEVGDKMTSNQFDKLFGGVRRTPESSITQREMDIAASIQVVTERVVLRLAKRIKEETGSENLCLAGGVALNCVANGVLSRSGLFKELWVQPASGDAGTALGAAYCGYYHSTASSRIVNHLDSMKGSYLGNSYSDDQIADYLSGVGAVYKKMNEKDLLNCVADAIDQDYVVGWFQGKMEFGPRALGNRSILGNPRSREMQSTLNLKIKNRESFRPFAPAVLDNHAEDWFDIRQKSPYMLIVSPIANHRKHLNAIPMPDHIKGTAALKYVNSEIPAVTHVDDSARVQTVDGRHNPLFYKLLQNLYRKTHCPVVINTSFNVRGEPIVESPRDAYTCFMRTNMDYLIIGSMMLRKDQQPKWQEKSDWRIEYALD